MPRCGLGQPGVSVLVKLGVSLESLCWPAFGCAGYNCVAKVSCPPGASMTCQFGSFRNVSAFQVGGLNGIFVPSQVEDLPGVPVMVYLEVWSFLCSGQT